MSFLSWLYNSDPLITNGEKAASYSPGHDYWYTDAGGGSQAGVTVNADTAMKASAVYACVRVLAETVAQLPLKVIEIMPDGRRREARDHPIYELLHDQPNSWQTSFEFREMMMGHLALRGNAYAEIIPGPRGFADQLIPIHPDMVRVEQTRGKVLVYEVKDRTGRARKRSQEEIIHLKLLSSDGITGLSPIQLGRDSIGLSLATESYGARFFKNDARPGGVITHPGVLKPEARMNLKSSWQQAHSGTANSHKTAVLEEGMKWEQIGMTSEDAQFLETRAFQITDIARIFRVPPHLISDLSKATFSNIEQQSLEFVIHTMMPHLVRWEQTLNKDLIINRRRFAVKFNVDGLLRGDAAARAAFYKSGITDGWLTRNEVREKENMNPLPGLDEPLTQLNMGSVSAPQPEENAKGNGHKKVFGIGI